MESNQLNRQGELIGLLQFTKICQNKCAVLKGHDDKLTNDDTKCLEKCADHIGNSYTYTRKRIQ